MATLRVHFEHLNRSGGCTFLKDSDLRLYQGDRAFLDFIGASSMEELRGLDDYAMPWGERYAQDYRRHDRDALRGLSYSTMEPCIDRNGQTVFMLAHKFPYYNQEGEVAGVVINTRQVQNRQLLMALAQLEDEIELSRFRIHPDLYNLSLYDGTQSKLTRRESLVFYHLLRGKTARAIAERLKISIRTAEKHIEIIKGKLNLQHRADLVDFGMRQGLMDILPPAALVDLLGS